MSVTDDIASACRALEPDLVRVRRELHARPELSGGEWATAAFVAGELERLGLPVVTGVGGAGVMADLGADGPVLLLRADMDALPLDEVAGREYGSTVPGVMHACGHDAHTAALLGAAALLSRRELPGRVRLLFQPAVGETARADAIDPGPLPFSDDFAHVAERVPTCYFGVGAGGPAAAPHHHPAFDVDERAIGLTAEILARAALAWRR